MIAIFFLIFLLGTTFANPTTQPKVDECGENIMCHFVKGFLEGINEGGDINKLLKCINGTENIIEKLKIALELILTFEYEKIVRGVTMLVETITKLIEILKPCASGFIELNKLWIAMLNTNIIKIVIKIIQHHQELYDDILYIIWNIGMFNFEAVGKGIGNILYRLYLDKSFGLTNQ